MEEAASLARLAVDTIETIAARVPDVALRRSFLGWSRVQAVRDDLDRLLRS